MEEHTLKKYGSLSPAQQQAVSDYVEFLYGKQREERLMQALRDLGFKDLADFCRERGLGDEKHTLAYITEELKKYLSEEIKNWETIVYGFEQKHKHDLPYFKAHFHEFTDFDELEKEDNEVEWEMAIVFIEAHRKTLSELL